MILVLGIAATAAASVIAFARWRERQPELALKATEQAQQLAAVVLLLSQAVGAVFEALAGRTRQVPSYAGRTPRYEPHWAEEESWYSG